MEAVLLRCVAKFCPEVYSVLVANIQVTNINKSFVGFRSCFLNAQYNRTYNIMFSSKRCICIFKMLGIQQRWSPRRRPWPRGSPRGHIFKSLALASKPTSPQKCPALGSRTALFFAWLKRKKQTKDNTSDSLSIRCFFSLFEK